MREGERERGRERLVLMLVCRCYAALGDMSKVRYLKEVSELADKMSVEMVSYQGANSLIHISLSLSLSLSLSPPPPPPPPPQGQDGTTHYLVEAKLAALNKHLKQAETILLERVRSTHSPYPTHSHSLLHPYRVRWTRLCPCTRSFIDGKRPLQWLQQQ